MSAHLEDDELIELEAEQLEEREHLRMRRHLEQCDECRSRYAKIATVITALRDAPSHEFRTNLEHRLRREVADAARLGPSGKAARMRRPAASVRLRALMGVAAAAAILVVAIGLRTMLVGPSYHLVAFTDHQPVRAGAEIVLENIEPWRVAQALERQITLFGAGIAIERGESAAEAQDQDAATFVLDGPRDLLLAVARRALVELGFDPNGLDASRLQSDRLEIHVRGSSAPHSAAD